MKVGLTEILIQVKDGLKLLASAVIALINGFFSIFGITIPAIIIQIGAIIFLVIFFWKWAKRLPLLILIILGLFFASFVVSIFD